MTNEELLRIIDQAADEEWETLDLAGNGLTELPSAIGKLTKLKSLILGKRDEEKRWVGNNLTALPPEIVQLTSLQTLDLRFNQLSSLPPEIGELGVWKEYVQNRSRCKVLSLTMYIQPKKTLPRSRLMQISLEA